ncbi:TetR/AcrR family transcriptional regulator [Nocardioides hwasunensis]|uniref:TetR/AcrR family transcriptional regulator n=1 Tax=Nocardioides hwasunensis TaxID=397258 RepID=A0ABR8MB06_9ACTN|nr:TetR/AcrR family transcriptional regulator [Nocardioides hwasunensis]MBD3913133.1 TetR/AcrR family transcriptional regulator [Nocardioides hwasunensis]
MTPTETGTRPRVEGERELEILEATLHVLDEVGYDLFTMDAVATRAKASKATLYRRWKGKPELVVAAIMAHKGEAVVPDTGSLRGDLLEAYCGSGGPSDPMAQSVLAAVVTAMTRDPEFAEVYRRDFIAPKIEASRAIYERARDRGELHPDADLSILAPSLIAILMHRSFLLGEVITPELIARVLDEVVLPAALHGPV